MSETPARQYRTRYHARWVLPVSAPPIEDGTVVVDGDRIAYAGPRAGAPPGRDEELGEAMLTPGLVNAHTHLDLTVMRGLLAGLPFFDWVRALVDTRAQLTADALLDSARLGIREGLRAGVTTYADTAPCDAPFEAMRELGVRGIAYREVFGPDRAQCDAAVADLRDAVTAMRARETALVRVGVSPHAPYSVSDTLYREVAEYARREELPLATHVAESEVESALVESGKGPFADFLRGRGIVVEPRARTPIALLERCGVLGENALLIHCVRCDAGDIAMIATHRCGVALCPGSNVHLGHDRAPVAALRDAGVRVGVGSDSMASNLTMDPFAEALLAMQPRGGGPHHPDQRAVWELATLGGACALGLDREIGSLEAGKQADLAAFPLGREAPRLERAAAASGQFGSSGPMMPAVLVVVAGRALVRDGRLSARDEGLEDRVTNAAAGLSAWERHKGAR